MPERVVITGLGAISPLGHTVAENWQAAVNGHSGITPITLFDASHHKSQIAGEVKNWDPDARFGRKEARKMDRFVQFALAAAQQAVEDARLAITDANRQRIGALIGAATCGLTALLEEVDVYRTRGADRISPFLMSRMLPDSAPGQVALTFGLRGPNLSLATACATGNNAIGEAYRMIAHGLADVMLAGATEAALVPVILAGFENMNALSTRNDSPTTASRPFSADRDGFVPAEGAGILVLESESHARTRDAHIYGEVCGYANTNDAYHMTAPSPDGQGAIACMTLALADAGLVPEDIDYINAHGTSTPLNDLTETLAIKAVFGDRAAHVPMSSTKSVHGHLLGAAGALEAVLSLQAIAHQVAPPTINHHTPDPACDLDYVPNLARPTPMRYVLSNSFGFGGHNACLVFGAYPAD